jgi:hypothetical protein
MPPCAEKTSGMDPTSAPAGPAVSVWAPERPDASRRVLKPAGAPPAPAAVDLRRPRLKATDGSISSIIENTVPKGPFVVTIAPPTTPSLSRPSNNPFQAAPPAAFQRRYTCRHCGDTTRGGHFAREHRRKGGRSG